ncbi:MAG: GIY-YIG nuclease family protein [Synergistaceae bacterium]|nr:GIY-YIG nuclease family protein [Synergistaceae bacterium]
MFIYLLRCSDSIAAELPKKRIEAHNSGRGAKYTKSRRPVELVYYEECESKSAAMKREWFIKHKMTREQKLKLTACS